MRQMRRDPQGLLNTRFFTLRLFKSIMASMVLFIAAYAVLLVMLAPFITSLMLLPPIHCSVAARAHSPSMGAASAACLVSLE